MLGITVALSSKFICFQVRCGKQGLRRYLSRDDCLWIKVRANRGVTCLIHRRMMLGLKGGWNGGRAGCLGRRRLHLQLAYRCPKTGTKPPQFTAVSDKVGNVGHGVVRFRGCRIIFVFMNLSPVSVSAHRLC
eukprot:TRINITY_DN15036_c0_g1_i1.p1 TRINITY_DN15036_c0_g1~~TRINITY_DN15036_c0_g1_i1.p1  ORF type:complete len:132 (+),score=0.38 TRINITY_DN15036_c0_g1_i1:150-545(+)